MRIFLFFFACTLACLYFAWRARAKYLAEDDNRIGGPELDRLGELLACPRRVSVIGMWTEGDASYRARLQAVVYGHMHRGPCCDTVRR